MKRKLYTMKLYTIMLLAGFCLFNIVCPEIEAGGEVQVFDPDASILVFLDEVELSYHGQLGYGTGLGMLEKWCALPNFSFTKEGGIDGWISRGCDECHIGAGWNPNKPEVDCLSCHPSVDQTNGTYVEAPTMEKCSACHKKNKAKRGDLFDADHEVHLRSDPQRPCQFCHTTQNHQIAKGSVIDTSEPTLTDQAASCTSSGCHSTAPHEQAQAEGMDSDDSGRLDWHCQKVACETCHTDITKRSSSALKSRDWTRFKNGQPVTENQKAGWVPEYKWYDGRGPSADYMYTPILDYAERRDSAGAKIYPFNVISVTWFIISDKASLDDIIPVGRVKAAGEKSDPDDPALLVTTQEAMRAYDDPDDGDLEPDYPEAALITRQMNFNLTHSIGPKEQALTCDDCHGRTGRNLLDWEKLGYRWGDPGKTDE